MDTTEEPLYIKEETMTEYRVPFEISVYDHLTAEAGTHGEATEKVRSYLLSHKQEWGNFDYTIDIKDVAPAEGIPVTNYYTVKGFNWGSAGNEQSLIDHFDLDSLFAEMVFDHGLVVETAQGGPVAVAWITVQLEDAWSANSIIGWVNFRVLGQYEDDETLILTQCLSAWVENEPQLHLFASEKDGEPRLRSLKEAGFKHAGIATSRTDLLSQFILCHRAGDQNLGLEMARLRV